MNLLPKDDRFFEYFDQHVRILCQVSHLLEAALKDGHQALCDAAKRIEVLERSADDVVHAAFETLRKTFITPFDPEDIQALVSSLDDVIDAIEDAAFRLCAYRLDPIPPTAVELGSMVASSCDAVGRALHALHAKRSVVADCVEVNRIEDEADVVQRTMLSQLFTTSPDPITLIKLKDLYEALETITDRCEDVADVIQSIAVKNL